MTPPFNLSRLVVAPITAPAAAPIAASRFVCLTVTSPPLDDVTVPPLELYVPALEPLLERRRVVVVRRVVVAREAVVRGEVRPAAGAFAYPASAGDIES